MSLSQAIEQPTRRLGDAKAVGRVLDLSWRTVYRLADAGKIPPGYKLGAFKALGSCRKSKSSSATVANRRKQRRGARP